MPGGRRRLWPPLLAVLVVALLTAAVAQALAASHPRTPRRATAAPDAGPSASEPSERVAPARPARRVGALVPQAPTSARLPSGTVVPVRPVSADRSGELAVPHDVRTAGWWRGGSRLGDPLGSTLLAAHVDSTTQGLGPYASLLSARRGQRIELSSRSLRQTFRVTSLRLLPQGSLARHAWVYSVAGPRRLTLVTCAGPYDRARGGYQRLAVVTAVPVSGPHRRGAR